MLNTFCSNRIRRGDRQPVAVPPRQNRNRPFLTYFFFNPFQPFFPPSSRFLPQNCNTYTNQHRSTIKRTLPFRVFHRHDSFLIGFFASWSDRFGFVGSGRLWCCIWGYVIGFQLDLVFDLFPGVWVDMVCENFVWVLVLIDETIKVLISALMVLADWWLLVVYGSFGDLILFVNCLCASA